MWRDTNKYNLRKTTMHNICNDLMTSPFALSLLLLHFLVFTQCVIKFIDYQVIKKQLEKLQLRNHPTSYLVRNHYEKM